MNLYKFLYWLQKKEFYLWLENDSLKFKQTQQLKNKEKVFLLLKSQKENIIKILKKNNIFSSNIKYPFIYKTDKTEAILSSAQERLFFLDQLEQGTNAYNIPYLLKLKKTIFPDIFVKAIKAVIDTNLILKTVYIEKQNSFIQQPLMKELEINSFTPENSKEFNSLLKNKFDYIFDLKNEFPIKVDVLEYNNSTFISLVFHHIAFDGWSTDIFFNEVEANYIKLTNPQQKCKDSSDNHSIQYKDFAVWQKNYITNNYLQEQLKFWKAYLEDYDNLNFPTDKKRPNNFNYKGNYTSINIPSNILDFFKTTAKNNNTSLFCTLLTTYYIFLYKYTGQNDIVIGTPFANRHINGTENIIGFFINTLPIRMNIDSNSTFQELIIKVNNHLEKIQKNQDIPFEQIVNSIDPEKDLSRTPIYQTTFAVHEKNDNKNQYYNFIGTEKFERTSKFDLDLTIIINNNTATIFFNYSTELFTRSYIKQISNHYIHLLSTLATSNHKQQIKDICLLTKEEYQTVVYDWNKTDFPILKDKNVLQLFEEQAKKTPYKIAVYYQNQYISYSELNNKASKLANFLKNEHINFNTTKETYIPIILNKSIGMIISILAILKYGAAYIPIDPQLPISRIKFIIEDISTNILLTDSKNIQDLSKHFTPISLINIDAFDLSDKQRFKLDNIKSSNAYVIYTSGTTGTPKGVKISHQNLIDHISFCINTYGITRIDKMLQFSTVSFDISIEEIFPILSVGGVLSILPNNKISPVDLNSYLHKYKISKISIPTAYWHYLIQESIDNKWRLSKYLKTIIIGGEKAQYNLFYPWYKIYKNKITTINTYGPTETTVVATYINLNNYNNYNLKLLPIGKPKYNCKAYILDNDLIPVPIGTTGELYIGGACLSSGYLNDLKLTQKKFIKVSYLNHDRLYKTGDLCSLSRDGNIIFKTRNDSQIKLRGFRIELSEIESKINNIPEIKMCFVKLHKSDDRQQIIAYYILDNTNANFNSKDILLFLQSELPEYMIPSFFIKIEKLPLTINGKIDIKSLPLPNISQKVSKHQKPKSNLEKHLINIWQNVLNNKKINIFDNFFHIGGDSILSIKLSSEIKKQLKLNLSVSDIFKYPTIHELSKKFDSYSNLQDISINKLKKIYNNYIFLIDLLKNNIDISTTQNTTSNILLTGCTGFLGTYLLAEIIEKTNHNVYCLIRNKNNTNLIDTFNAALNYYNKSYLINNNRIILVKGDLSKENLGIEKKVYKKLITKTEYIFHNGANVNHLYNFDTLHSENLNSTYELIKLANTGRSKKIFYISTFSVNNLPNISNLKAKDIRNITGYEITKYLSEQILLYKNSQYKNIKIFRPGNITGDIITGVSNYTQNHHLLFLKGCIQMGVAPKINIDLEMIPVNIISKSIVEISFDKNTSSIHNLNNPNTISWIDYIKKVNKYGKYSIKMINIKKWLHELTKIDDTNALYPFKEYYSNLNLKTITSVKKDNIHSDIDFYSDYNSLIKLYINHLQKQNFLPTSENK